MAQTVFDVGDAITSRLKLGIVPDGTTNVTITVTRPDGTAIVSPALSGWINTDEKVAQWYATDDGTPGGTRLSAAGDWLIVWTVTGTGASVTAKVYPVRELPGTSTRPAWSPFLSDVADFVPVLTIDATAPGSQTYLGTFTGNTSPTDEQAQRHVDAAVAFVGAGFGTLTVPLQRMARTVAAMRAAATLARAFARDAGMETLAASLERQAAADLKALIAAVEDASATTLSTVPVLYAPQPVEWGDQLFQDFRSYPYPYNNL